jgi:hypothetical protein
VRLVIIELEFGCDTDSSDTIGYKFKYLIIIGYKFEYLGCSIGYKFKYLGCSSCCYASASARGAMYRAAPSSQSPAVSSCCLG